MSHSYRDHAVAGGFDSLRRRANARNVSFRISLRWPIHNINPVDKTKLSFVTRLDENERRLNSICKVLKNIDIHVFFSHRRRGMEGGC